MIKLTSLHLHQLVQDNKYRIGESKFESRCVDGRYENYQELPALTIPGGDAGELAIIYAAGDQYGFEVDQQKTLYTLADVVGGAKNFSFHSDNHHKDEGLAAGCGHMGLIKTDPNAYGLQMEQVKTILDTQLPCMMDLGAKQTILSGDHKEAAAVIVNGPWGIYPQYKLETDVDSGFVQVFVFHKYLIDERHKVLVKKLITDQAVKLYDGLDEEYLFEVLSEVTEVHFLEMLKKLAQGLPLFQVNFKDDEFKIEDMGII